MSYNDKITELEGKLKAEVEKENPPAETETKETEAPAVEQEQPKEDAPATEEVEEKAPEVEAKDEEPPSTHDFARLRILEKKNRELEQKMREAEQAAETAKPKQQAPAEDEEPNRDEDYGGWLEYQNRKLEKQVSTIAETIERERRLKELEDAMQGGFRELAESASGIDDFADAMEHMAGILATAKRIESPNMSQEQIKKIVQLQVLRIAGEYQSKQYNPAAALYKISEKEFGYSKKAKSAPEEQKASAVNLDRIASAQKRSSAVPAPGGAAKGSHMTAEEFKALSIVQKAALPKSVIDQLLANA